MRRGKIDDNPGPARTTPARLAKVFEDLAAQIAEVAIRGRRYGAFVDDGRLDELCTRMFRASQLASDLSLDVLVGKSPILPGLVDTDAGRGDRPLLDRIEAASGEHAADVQALRDQHHADMLEIAAARNEAGRCEESLRCEESPLTQPEPAAVELPSDAVDPNESPTLLADKDCFDILAPMVLGLPPEMDAALDRQEFATLGQLGEFLDDTPFEEIARTLGLPADTVDVLCQVFYDVRDRALGYEEQAPAWAGERPRCDRCRILAGFVSAPAPNHFDRQPRAKWICSRCFRVLATFEPPTPEPAPFVPDYEEIEASVAPSPKKKARPKNFDVFIAEPGKPREFLCTVAGPKTKAKAAARALHPHRLKGLADMEIMLVPTPETPAERDSTYQAPSPGIASEPAEGDWREQSVADIRTIDLETVEALIVDGIETVGQLHDRMRIGRLADIEGITAAEGDAAAEAANDWINARLRERGCFPSAEEPHRAAAPPAVPAPRKAARKAKPAPPSDTDPDAPALFVAWSGITPVFAVRARSLREATAYIRTQPNGKRARVAIDDGAVKDFGLAVAADLAAPRESGVAS